MQARSLRFALPFVAVMLAASPALAAGVAPNVATEAQRADATKSFIKGRDLFGEKKFEPALAEFKSSYDVVASPNTRLYIARCHRELGHLTLAYAEFTHTADDAKALAKDEAKYQTTAEAATTERQDLANKLGFVDLSLTHPGASTVVKVGGDVVARDAWSQPVPVAPGAVDVVVESEGRPPVVQSVQVAAGEHKAVPVDAGADAPVAPPVVAVETPQEAPKKKKVPLRTLAYVAGGVGVAGFATFAIFGLMSNSTYSGLQDSCANNVCPPNKSGDISTGKTQQTIANIGLVVGAVGVAAGVTLFVISNKKDTSTAAATARVTAGPGYVGLQGAF
jgi:hypothetical protein